MARDAGARGEGEEIVVSLGVACRVEGNGTKGAASGSVGWVVVFENLCRGTEFDAHRVEIGRRGAAYNGGGTHGAGDAGDAWELVETTDTIGNHSNNNDLGEAPKGETVHTGAETLLDRPNGALNLANVAIGGSDVHFDGTDFFANTFEFIVSMNVGNKQPAGTVKVDSGGKFSGNCRMSAIGNDADGAETDIPGDGVEETDSLDKKNQRIASPCDSGR